MNFLVLIGFTYIWSYGDSSCVTPLGQTSQCVSLYDCKELLNAYEQRPLPSHVVSFLRQSKCGFEGFTPKVCCGPLPYIRNESMPTSTPTPPTISEKIAYPEDSYPMPRDKCGIDNEKILYERQFSDLKDFPWMALIGYQTPRNTQELTYRCGGVLINHRYILSAAHCVVGEVKTAVGELSSIRLGEYDLQTDIDCIESTCADPVQEIAVHSAYPHPGFSDKNRNRKDDISLIRLKQRAQFTQYVQPICLTSSNSRLDPGSDVFVAGWGNILWGSSSPIKLNHNLPIFSKFECASKYQRLGVVLTDNQICAGGVFGSDACRSDSGGPLMRYVAGTWETVAVVSFSYGCRTNSWPGVYTSVASYRSWIEDTMRFSNVQNT